MSDFLSLVCAIYVADCAFELTKCVWMGVILPHLRLNHQPMRDSRGRFAAVRLRS